MKKRSPEKLLPNNAYKRNFLSPTVKDIAREADVSIASVSIALKNSDSSKVSKKTRQKILDIARKLNYQPNLLARSLVTRKSNTIGLVITTLHNPFYSELAQDIINRSEELGYHVFTSSVYGKTKGEYEAVEGLISRGVDGLIICSALRKDPVIEGLLKHKLPFILAMRKTDIKPNDRPIDCIEIDNELGGYIAMDHLLNLGHERIGLLTGPIITSTGYYRRVGALSACKKKKIGLRKITVIEGDFNRESGRKLSRELLFGKHKPTAIFAGNDHMAIGVMDTLLDLGIKCPQDIALVGFDDIEMAGLPGVGLTTVSQKKSLMGSLAVDQLMEQIKLKDQYLFKRKILEPQLVIRKSCGYYNR